MSIELPIRLSPLTRYQLDDKVRVERAPLRQASAYSDEELAQAFTKWGTPESGMQYIARSRRCSPSRTVKSGARNAVVYYRSRKMNVTLALESRGVEFPAALRYDLDNVTRELYCQPPVVFVPTRIKQKRQDGQLREFVKDERYTPDILRLLDEGPFVEEWKSEDKLRELASRYPWRYQKWLCDNTWHCPEKEKFFAAMGITFCLRSSAEHNQIFTSNLDHLRDYLCDLAALSDSAWSAIEALIKKEKAVSLLSLIHQAFDDVTPWNEAVLAETPPSRFRVDDIYKAIAEGRIHVDLEFDDLSEPHEVVVCASREQLELIKWYRPPPHAVTESTTFDLEVGTEFLFRGNPEVFAISGLPYGTVLFYNVSSKSSAAEMPVGQFESSIYEGQIVVLSSPTNTAKLLQDYEYVPDKEVEKARDRFLVLESRKNKGPPLPCDCGIRHIQRLAKLLREVGDSRALQMRALIRRKPGGRGQQIDDSTVALIKEVACLINNPTNEPISNAYIKFRDLCKERNVRCCSKNTFYRRLRHFLHMHEREGSRRAYNAEPQIWYLKHEDKVHGGRPFHRVHIDHTKLDIIIKIRGRGGRLYRLRPWLTIIVDETTRMVLGFYLAAHAPSTISCMMAIRHMIQIHKRMPEIIVVDWGKEFHSQAFKIFCYLNDVRLEARPYHESRFGGVIERMFGVTNQLLIHKLLGNTKAMRHVRTVTRQVDPSRADHMSFAQLHGLLEHFFFIEYNRERVHPAHDHTPEQYMNKGFCETGRRLRRLCPYDRKFHIQTCVPPSRGVTRTVDPSRGIKIGPLYYWTDEFQHLHRRQRQVKVLIDMWDVSVAYACIDGRHWTKCVSKLLMRYRRLTAIELRYVIYEVRLRLRAAPEESFETLLTDVLNEHPLPEIADATAATQRLYGKHELTHVSFHDDDELVEPSTDDRAASIEQCTSTTNIIPSITNHPDSAKDGQTLMERFGIDYASLSTDPPLR